MRARRFAWLVAVVVCLGVLGAARPAWGGTSLELLHGWGYNKDWSGDRERTILTIKTFQPFKYGSFFMYYDITGPFTPPDATVLPNEKGGFFGGSAVNLSVKKIGEKLAHQTARWGALDDLSVHVELETVSRIGSLMYYGAQFDLRIPGFDFASTTILIRDDWSLRGAALQLGGAWQITLPLGDVTDLVFDGFFQWGVFGEGGGVMTVGPDDQGRYTKVPVRGRPFFLSQPQLLLDVGQIFTLCDDTLYAGVEYQLAWNRYLQPGVSENVPQIMLKWVL